MILPNLNVLNIEGIISTDDIIPARYKHEMTDPQLLSKHLFEKRFPGLSCQIQKPTVIVGNATFGVGSSREQAVSALLNAGVIAVLSPNFGRIFFRNCWNLGLIAIETDTTLLNQQTHLAIDLSENRIIFSKSEIRFGVLPVELINTFKVGGLLAYIQNVFQLSREG